MAQQPRTCASRPDQHFRNKVNLVGKYRFPFSNDFFEALTRKKKIQVSSHPGRCGGLRSGDDWACGARCLRGDSGHDLLGRGLPQRAGLEEISGTVPNLRFGCV